MSDLHLSLMIFGVVVIVGVVAYNWIQEQRFRKMAQQRFQAPRDDVLMSSDDAMEPEGPVVEDRMQEERIPVERNMDERIEPSFGQDFRPEPATKAAPMPEAPPVAEPVVKSPAVTPNKSQPASPAGMDSTIDYIVRLEFAEPMQAAAVRAAVGNDEFGKITNWEGLQSDGHWVLLENVPDRNELTSLSGGLQLADRAGALEAEDLSRFVQHVQEIGEVMNAVLQLPERQAALDNAAKLDAFCADVDILVGMNVIALEQDKFVGTKIRALAEAAGFTLDEDGTYHYRDDNGNVLYSLSNQESEPFHPDAMRNLTTHGLTLLFDVPRVSHGLRTFDQMLAFARHLTDSLRGMLVDDNLRPLSEEGVSKIKQQLSMIYGKMDKHGIAAGSPRALRLFS